MGSTSVPLTPYAEPPLESRTDKELVALAEALVSVRPLVPYPGWRFDADWHNPDLAFQLRRRIWSCFERTYRTGEIVVPWHHRLRLVLYLGNDVSKQIFIGGCIDPNEFAWLDQILAPGMTFLDAGANEGIYALFAARRVSPEGSVWAFEPSSRELERLRRNILLNQLSNIRVFPVALTDVDGEADLLVAEAAHSGQNTLGALAYEGIRVDRRERVPMATLDLLAERHGLARADVIKLDVEGAECRALSGAAGIIAKFRPVILFEVLEPSLRHQGTSAEQLLGWLTDRDYCLYAFDQQTGLPMPVADGAVRDPIVAVPAEKPLPASTLVQTPHLD